MVADDHIRVSEPVKGAIERVRDGRDDLETNDDALREIIREAGYEA